MMIFQDLEDGRRKRNRRQRGSVSFSSSASSSEDQSHSDSDSISGAESISEGSLPDSPRLVVSKTNRKEMNLEVLRLLGKDWLVVLITWLVYIARRGIS